MRSLIALAALWLIAADVPASAAASYDAVCPSACVAPDGTQQPAGTVLGRGLWNGSDTWAPTDATGLILTLTPTTNPPAAVWSPKAVVPTTIDPLGFMARLTPAEQTAIATAGQSNAQILLFLLKLSGATQIDVTDPLTVAGMNAMIGAGLLTAQRGAQIMNLAVASP